MSNFNVNGKEAAELLKDSAKKVATKAVEGAQRITDAASHQLKITSVKAKRDAEFTRLGRLTYKKLKSDAPNTDIAEKIAATVENIDRLAAELRALEKQGK